MQFCVAAVQPRLFVQLEIAHGTLANLVGRAAAGGCFGGSDSSPH